MQQQYLTFGDIQGKIIEHFLTTGNGIDFRTAYLSLMEAGSYRVDLPEMPDFLSWNRKEIRELARLAYDIPILFSEINLITPSYLRNSNITLLPTVAEVQINFETAYSPDTFTVLEYFIVIYVLEGTTIVHFPNKTQTLKAGELMILPPGIPHYSYHKPSDYVLNIMSDKTHFETNFFHLFDIENMISTFFKNTLKHSTDEFLMFQLPLSDSIRAVIAQLFSEYCSKASYSSLIFNNYLQIFYFNLLRNSGNSYEHFRAEGERIPKVAVPAIIQFIQEHYKDLSLNTLAAEFHYDTAYLSKLIKKYTNKNYSQIITELKIGEAKKLLLNPNVKIEQIADMVGYHSSDHFTHTFHHVMGISPTVYRKQISSSERACWH